MDDEHAHHAGQAGHAVLGGPAPSINPNLTINPATGMPYEGRTRAHQAPPLGFPFPTTTLYEVHQRAAQVRVSPDLPLQTLWTFDGISPGPTYVARYGTPFIVRNYNDLPTDNGGFGLNSVTTHLHNGHTPSESDGFPCDYFAAGRTPWPASIPRTSPRMAISTSR